MVSGHFLTESCSPWQFLNLTVAHPESCSPGQLQTRTVTRSIQRLFPTKFTIPNKSALTLTNSLQLFYQHRCRLN